MDLAAERMGKEITKGFLRGILGQRVPNISRCGIDSDYIEENVKKAVAYLLQKSTTGYKKGLDKMAKIVLNVEPSVTSCIGDQVDLGELHKLKKEFKRGFIFYGWKIINELTWKGKGFITNLEDALELYE